jgi:dephospho-CoA kinase
VKTIGLTGGIACGKSTVAGLLRGHGVPIIDADQVSRQIFEPGTPALAEIAATFGPSVIQADGTLDRKALGALVMGTAPEQAERRSALNAITHPRIWAETVEQLRALAEDGCVLAGVEAAIMIEGGSYTMYDLLVVVACAPAVQVERLCARQGITPTQAQAWIQSQMPVAEKVALADVVISNDADLSALREATARGLSKIRDQLGLPAPQ